MTGTGCGLGGIAAAGLAAGHVNGTLHPPPRAARVPSRSAEQDGLSRGSCGFFHSILRCVELQKLLPLHGPLNQMEGFEAAATMFFSVGLECSSHA